MFSCIFISITTSARHLEWCTVDAWKLLLFFSLCLMNPIPTVQQTAKQLSSTKRTSVNMRSVYQLLLSRAGGTVDLWTLCCYSVTEWIVKHLVPPTCSVIFLFVTCFIQYRVQMHFNLLPYPTLPIFSSFGGLALSYWPSGLTVQYVTKYTGLLPWEPGVNNVLFKGPFF